MNTIVILFMFFACAICFSFESVNVMVTTLFVTEFVHFSSNRIKYIQRGHISNTFVIAISRYCSTTIHLESLCSSIFICYNDISSSDTHKGFGKTNVFDI